MKYNCFTVLFGYLFIALFFTFGILNAKIAKATNDVEILVSTDNHREKLKNTLRVLSQKYGLVINIEQQLSQQTIGGVFQEEPFDSFIRRTLKGINIIVTYNKKKRVIDILSFGSKNSSEIVSLRRKYPPVGDDILDGLNPDINNVVDVEGVLYNPDAIEPLTGISLREIAMIEQAENIAYSAYLNDPNSREPLTGMSLKEIELIKNRENKSYSEYISNPESIEPFTRLTLGEIRKAQKNEAEQYENYNSSYQNSIDLLPRLTLGEISDF